MVVCVLTKSPMVDGRIAMVSTGTTTQHSPWVAVQSTLAPHIQQVVWFTNRNAKVKTYSNTNSVTILWRPKDDIGSAFNQAPGSLQEARQARE